MTTRAEAPAADLERLLADHPPELQAIERALRRAIREAAPTAVEHVDFPDSLIAVGWSMRMRDLLFAIICHKAHVNVQLADGARLPDPAGIVEGTGRSIRHVKVRTLEAATGPALGALIRAQLAIRPAGDV